MTQTPAESLVTIDSINLKGAAAGAGLKVGDPIISIDGVTPTSPGHGATLLKSAVGEVLIIVRREAAEKASRPATDDENMYRRRARAGLAAESAQGSLAGDAALRGVLPGQHAHLPRGMPQEQAAPATAYPAVDLSDNLFVRRAREGLAHAAAEKASPAQQLHGVQMQPAGVGKLVSGVV